MVGTDFNEYFATAHHREELTEREKALVGLAVTLSRGYET